MKLNHFQQELIPTYTSAIIEVPNGIIFTHTRWGYPAARYFYGDAALEVCFDTQQQLEKWIDKKIQEEVA